MRKVNNWHKVKVVLRAQAVNLERDQVDLGLNPEKDLRAQAVNLERDLVDLDRSPERVQEDLDRSPEGILVDLVETLPARPEKVSVMIREEVLVGLVETLPVRPEKV